MTLVRFVLCVCPQIAQSVPRTLHFTHLVQRRGVMLGKYQVGSQCTTAQLVAARHSSNSAQRQDTAQQRPCSVAAHGL